jgi:hypothetical protein
MKKNNRLFLIITLGLVIVALGLWWTNRGNSTLQTRAINYDFAIPDTAAITRIEISDKTPCSVTLTRVNGQWTVEGEPVRPDAIEVLLETLKRMEMRNFITTAERPSILKKLAVYGKEVKVYSGETLLKHLYVGTETPDFLGTYMMIQGADAPYSVHILGFNGYLSTRFFCNPDLWRSRVMFGLQPTDIQKATLHYRDSAGGFVLENKADGRWVVTPERGSPYQPEGTALNLFLSAFKTLQYEGVITPEDGIWNRQDSLKRSSPAFVLELVNRQGNTFVLQSYSIVKNPDEEALGIVNNSPFDPDRFHSFYQDRFILTQRFGMRWVLVGSRYFAQPPAIVPEEVPSL